jgi:hypothetical protein
VTAGLARSGATGCRCGDRRGRGVEPGLPVLQGKYTGQAYRALRDTQEHINEHIFNSTNDGDASAAFLYSSDYIYCERPRHPC